MTHFLEPGKKKREGYQPSNVTPYLHILLYHVPFFVSKYGSLSKFTGQGVEKTNDIIKQIHQSKSNKLDATAEFKAVCSVTSTGTSKKEVIFFRFSV